MSRPVISLIAIDRPGIVSLIVDEINARGWTSVQAWAETRCQTFIFILRFNGGHRETPSEAALHDFEEFLRARIAGVQVLLSHRSGAFNPEDDVSDFVADVTIEGDRGLEILGKTARAMADESATITSMRTEVLHGQIRYIVRATYSSPAKMGLHERLSVLSESDHFDFISESNDRVAAASFELPQPQRELVAALVTGPDSGGPMRVRTDQGEAELPPAARAAVRQLLSDLAAGTAVQVLTDDVG